MRSMYFLRFIVISLTTVLSFSLAYAEDWPTGPIKLIIPFAPGGGVDGAGRMLAQALEEKLKVSVIVDNKAGANGTIAMNFLRQSKPDGYTIAQMPITVFRYPHMQKVSWDPFKDFSWIVGVTGYTFGVVVRADSPWKTWAEFIAYAKANPDKVTYGTPGLGTSLHMTMEEIAIKEGVKWIHVPFKGNADAATALMGGHITASADSTGWAEQIQSGRFRLLVTWGAERTHRWPEVPTLKELGYNIISNSPYGLAGPKNMDPAVVKIIHDAVKKAIEDPLYQKTLERLDQENFYLSTEEYARHVKIWFDEEKANVARIGLSLKP